MTPIRAFVLWWQCVKRGAHVYKADTCVVCGARRDGQSLSDILAGREVQR